MTDRTIRLTIAFDGTDYCGWQKQKNGTSIQSVLEEKLSVITDSPVTLHGAGRTDAGVHALAMTAHFHTRSTIGCSPLQAGLNSMLPRSIRITESQEESPTFHARFSARAKTYLYRIYTGPVQSPIERLYMVHIPFTLNLEAMKSCLTIICGTHDFASFEASGSRDKTRTDGRGAVRTILTSGFKELANETYQFEFTGDGFLRHMVRNLVGTILEVGKGRRSVDEFKAILAAKDRSQAGSTAPAHGLYLKEIFYND